MNPLQRAALVRKVSYVAAILVLFTISMVWRGALPVPLGASTAAAAEPFRWAADHTIQSQAQKLEVWELDPNEGEAEVTGSALRLMLTGSRGFAVTALWLSAIDKQRRNDFHEFEQRVRMVTKLQPNFISPWLFQSWNISYNVSVEMHGSGDMYFYIVRGIELLAEGERRNKRSPDMRWWIGFYYQNKFGVSDQVETLRCLFDLSCIPPSDRKPERFYDLETGAFDLAAFERFAEKHPHLVRRLRGEDQRSNDARAKEKIRCATPQEVVQFLKDNWEVPSRYRANSLGVPTDELADADDQFPVLPPAFNEAPQEANPETDTSDDFVQKVGYFSAYKAARGWFSYSLVLLPPPLADAQGVAVAGPTPEAGTFGHDPLKHRIPRQPAMVIFRQTAPRAQSYAAELEQKEGWFDGEGWRIDDPRDQPSKWWFPDPANPGRPKGVVVGEGRAWALDEWVRAAEMWNRHAKDNGLAAMDPIRRRVLEEALGDPSSVPANPTPEQLADPELRKRYVAKMALEFYGPNRSVTNFPYFLAAANAEAYMLNGKPITVLARKTLWQAEQARKIGDTRDAIRLYKDGLEQWKQVLIQTKDFHRPERSDRTEEETYGFELAYLRLLVQDDPRVRERANQIVLGAQAAVRAAARVAPPAGAAAALLTEPFPAGPTLGPLWTTENREEIKWYVAEHVAGADFSSPFVGSVAPADGGPWVSEHLKEQVRMNQGVSRKPQPADPAEPPPAP